MKRKLVSIHEAAEALGVSPQTLRRWEREDVNAARNLLAHGLAALSGSTASSAGCEACGGEGSGLGGDAKAKPAPMKQEVSFVPV